MTDTIIMLKLDLDKIRQAIPHTIGNYSTKDGKLLCNGHCDWNECEMDRFQCQICGYIECEFCGEDWLDALADLYPEIDGLGIEICRNCLNQDCIVEI